MTKIVTPQSGVWAAVFKTANDWNGAGEAVGATHGYEPDHPGFIPVPGRTFIDNPALIGRAGQRVAKTGPVSPPAASFAHSLRYEGQINLFPALWFGTETISDIDEGTVTVGTQHLFTIHDSLIGINGCHAQAITAEDDAASGPSDTVYVTEIDSFKVDQFVVSWSNGSRVMIEPTIFPRRVLEEGETSDITNTTTETDAVTLEGTDADDVADDSPIVRINGHSDGALGSGDIVDCNEFTLTFNRALGVAEAHTVSMPYQKEPVPTIRAGFEVTADLTLADFDARTFWQNHRDGDDLKFEVEMPGALFSAASTETHNWIFRFPIARILDGYEVSPGDRYTQTLPFGCFVANSAPTGMSDDAAPHAILSCEDRTAKYLA